MIIDWGVLMFVYWKVDGLVGIFIFVVFYYILLNDGGMGMFFDLCCVGEILWEIM